jgi:hypothetical protein
MRTLSDVRDDLGTLRATLPSPDAALVDLFLSRLSQWREDDASLETLIRELNALVAEQVFSTHDAHARVALALAGLHDSIDAVGGMTMNERLFSFDLLDRWDQASEDQRTILYEKVLAKR